MTGDVLTIILSQLQCPPYTFGHGPLGDGWFLRVDFTAAEGPQHGRKWYVSPFATESEIVQTALKAALTAEEHEIRERFRYAGRAVFAPHFDVYALMELADQARTDTRQARTA